MNKKILIVDDEELIHTVVSRGLADQPFTLIHASDGIEAIKKAQEESPDLILLDINMPNMDGRQVLQDLRGNAATKSIRVIMLTGLAGTMDKVAGFELGADDYVTKPFEMKTLLKRIRTAFR